MNPHRPRRSASPSSIQTILSALELHQVMRKALVGCTTDREFHPAPKVKYFVAVIIMHIVGTQVDSLQKGNLTLPENAKV